MSDDFDVSDIDRLLDENFHEPNDIDKGELAKVWQLRNLTNAYEERPPLRFLVDTLLPCPSLSIVYGGPGSLKSMLLADLAVCVASGRRWLQPTSGQEEQLGAVSFVVSQAPILWIDFDNGKRRTDERFSSLAKSRELPPDTPVHYVSMPRPWLDASNAAMMDDLRKLIVTIDAKLVVIDNLGLVSGDVEENSADMARVMGNLRWLCEEGDAAVVVIHHQRKSSSTTNGVRKGETLRGHSSIEAALDLALVVERKPGEDSVAVIPTKVRGYQAFQMFGALFTYQHRDDTTDMETARFWSWTAGTREEMENLHVMTLIKQVVRDKPGTYAKDIVDEVRDRSAARPGGKAPGINKIRGLLKEMIADGFVLTERDENGNMHYVV